LGLLNTSTGTDACTERDALQAKLRYPDCVYGVNETRANVTAGCMTNLSTWLNESMPLLTDAEAACDEEEDDLTLANETASCNTKQTMFESAYCQWVGRVKGSWDTYDTCYTNNSALYNSVVDSEKAKVALRKDQYIMATFLKCLLVVIRNDWRNHTLCDKQEVDTTALNITETDPPLPQKLSRTQIVKEAANRWPCTQGNWKELEYFNGREWGHLTADCVECSMLT